MVGSRGVDTVLIGNYLPELGTNLTCCCRRDQGGAGRGRSTRLLLVSHGAFICLVVLNQILQYSTDISGFTKDTMERVSWVKWARRWRKVIRGSTLVVVPVLPHNDLFSDEHTRGLSRESHLTRNRHFSSRQKCIPP